MKLGTFTATAFFIFATSAITVHASQWCDGDKVCVVSEENGDTVDFIAKNNTPYPVTVSVRAIRKRNVRAPDGDTATRTLAGGASEHLVRLLRKRPDRDTDYGVSFDWTYGMLSPDHDHDYLYRLPYAKNERPWVLQGYGSRFSHTGREEFTVDFDMDVGTRVFAARGGVVIDLEESHSKGCWESGCGRYANFVVILHSDGTTGEYYHLDHEGVLVNPGDTVERGDLIARSGNTGHTTMPHLHFGVYRAHTWGRTQSIPVKFQTRTGVVARIRAGRVYEVE